MRVYTVKALRRCVTGPRKTRPAAVRKCWAIALFQRRRSGQQFFNFLKLFFPSNINGCFSVKGNVFISTTFN